MTHWVVEPMSVLRLAFLSDALPTELFPPLEKFCVCKVELVVTATLKSFIMLKWG